MQQQDSSDLNARTVMLDLSSWSQVLESQVVYIHAAYKRNLLILQAESCQETIIVLSAFALAFCGNCYVLDPDIVNVRLKFLIFSVCKDVNVSVVK